MNSDHLKLLSQLGIDIISYHYTNSARDTLSFGSMHQMPYTDVSLVDLTCQLNYKFDSDRLFEMLTIITEMQNSDNHAVQESYYDLKILLGLVKK